MSLFEKYKKISKLKNKSTLSFNTVKLNRNSKHLLGINGKNHVAILFNASKPKGPLLASLKFAIPTHDSFWVVLAVSIILYQMFYIRFLQFFS